MFKKDTNTGGDNSGDYNSGDRNSGDGNSGNRNSGNRNSGYGNSGDRNSGNYNSGYGNSGYGNSGYGNSGDRNSGNYNSGYGNSGYGNSGDGNSGNRNSGNRNSGYGNSGHYNSGNYNSGFFNTNEPTVRLFNKDTGLLRKDIKIPYIPLPITELDSTLITRTYKEAWAIAWSELDQQTKQQFLDLPNFCPDIFKEITGIDVQSKPSCNGKIVEIDGKKYKLTEV